MDSVLLSGFVALGSHAAWNAVIATEDIIHILLFLKLGESDCWSLYPAEAEKNYRSCHYNWMTENKSNDHWHSYSLVWQLVQMPAVICLALDRLKQPSVFWAYGFIQLHHWVTLTVFPEKAEGAVMDKTTNTFLFS